MHTAKYTPQPLSILSTVTKEEETEGPGDENRKRAVAFGHCLAPSCHWPCTLGSLPFGKEMLTVIATLSSPVCVLCCCCCHDSPQSAGPKPLVR